MCRVLSVECIHIYISVTFSPRYPVQACEMKCCDAIAASGVSGLMDPVQAGLACGSDTAHLSMFGYDPRQYYRGRGAFETMGAGLDMLPGDIAFKVTAPPPAYPRRCRSPARSVYVRVFRISGTSLARGLIASTKVDENFNLRL